MRMLCCGPKVTQLSLRECKLYIVPGLSQTHLSIFFVYCLFFACLSGTSRFSHPKKRAIWLIKCQRLRPDRKKRTYILANHILYIFACTILPFKTQVESDETQDETATWMQEVYLCKLSHFGSCMFMAHLRLLKGANRWCKGQSVNAREWKSWESGLKKRLFCKRPL